MGFWRRDGFNRKNTNWCQVQAMPGNPGDKAESKDT